MNKKIIILIILGIFVVIAISGGIFFFNNISKNTQQPQSQIYDRNQRKQFVQNSPLLTGTIATITKKNEFILNSKTEQKIITWDENTRFSKTITIEKKDLTIGKYVNIRSTSDNGKIIASVVTLSENDPRTAQGTDRVPSNQPTPSEQFRNQQRQQNGANNRPNDQMPLFGTIQSSSDNTLTIESGFGENIKNIDIDISKSAFIKSENASAEDLVEGKDVEIIGSGSGYTVKAMTIVFPL